MKTIAFLIFLMLTTMNSVFSQDAPPPVEPGVSEALARWRATNYSDVRYKLSIKLEKGAPLMKGSVEIRFKLAKALPDVPVVIDWRPTQFENDKDKPSFMVTAVNEQMDFRTQYNREHILIPGGYFNEGENVVRIDFASPIKTSGAAVTRYTDKEDGGEYIYSLFVPSDASTAFPVFDQPDLKARFQLDLAYPARWNAVSNTRIRTTGEPKCADLDKCLQSSSFEETKPISSYVFAFAAGDFAEFDEAAYDPPPVKTAPPGSGRIYEPARREDGSHIYVRKSQAEKFGKHAKEVFRLNRAGVEFLESWFDYKFPFPKYDLVLIPEFPFGGMEHAGATFLRESSVIFPSEPTKNDLISRANVIFHEAAHQWFGDTVTMRWFDDLWLKEGFAEFMAFKTLEKVMPEYNAWKAFYERNKPLAYLTDSTRGTTPIYQTIPNLSAAKSAYGNIVYRKAPSFLRQAEFFLGEDKFQTAVRTFLKKHEFANASWQDLVNEFETASKQDLKDWANVWVKQRGLAKITVLTPKEPNYNCAKQYSLKQTNNFGDEVLWRMGLKVLIVGRGMEKGDTRAIENVELSNSEKVIYETDNCRNMPSLEPVLIFPNYQDYGYGIFLLDDKSRAYVLQNIGKEKDDFLRSMMWGALWDSVREAELDPKDYVELAIGNVAVETDESTIQAVLGRVGTALNYYLSDAARDRLAPRLEAVLTERIKNAKTQGQRITYYRAYLSLASSAAARQNLRDILAGTSKLAVFDLRTKDKFDLVTRLMILGDPAAPDLLAKLEKTETSDDAKRYAYAARAGTATTENKARYFRDFMTNREISESWIEAAFGPFNSPKHSELTLPYLETALAELPNLKKNRKIFFVNGWLGAFIGGQKSPEALAVVNKFLESNQNLDKDLRLKVLENVDNLERAVKIRAKFGK
ncbi:MAG: ERAP1-like C-terminal domain-containing protein [Acidobacteria bacterium]|nr:ERAP1-like C-terminal domain-containing protein [Acidobacteriota bacterium]